MKTLVTGANGLLATNIIIELVDNGKLVRGLIRNPNRFLLKKQAAIELVCGDITKIEDIRTAALGCDSIIHVAAITSHNILNYSEYEKTNVEGTRNVLLVAEELKIKKIVYVSSANTIGYGTQEIPGSEISPIKAPFSNCDYAKSKYNAQVMLMEAANLSKIEIVIVNPTFMLGPYDSKPSSGQIILIYFNKKIIFIPPGGKNFIHVRDAAIGVCKALEKGKNGEIYLLSNENMSYKDFFKLLLKVTNTKALIIILPKIILLPIGLFGNLLKTIGIRTSLSLNNMKILCIKNYYSNKKAVSELELKVTPVSIAITDAIAWFKLNKMVD
ncbi:MAG: NAD-dependent epimerase/dehydratase family protein [Bacteroidota bacterium]|nr:NAD-dependent epimerase/dehydratase family protein [Bacteroidota bacterium]